MAFESEPAHRAVNAVFESMRTGVIFDDSMGRVTPFSQFSADRVFFSSFRGFYGVCDVCFLKFVQFSSFSTPERFSKWFCVLRNEELFLEAMKLLFCVCF